MNFSVILSGGTGSRTGMNIPKQYIKNDAGKTAIECCISSIVDSDIADVFVIAADPDRYDEIRKLIHSGCEHVFTLPGRTRQLSVCNALDAIYEKYGDAGHTVMIYDAARPYISPDHIKSIYGSLKNADGVIPVLPMKDTVYECENGLIKGLLKRENIFAGQAPELFVFDKYLKANKALFPEKIYNIKGSTEPAVLYGMNIVTVKGDERNIKITTAKDMEQFMQYKG